MWEQEKGQKEIRLTSKPKEEKRCKYHRGLGGKGEPLGTPAPTTNQGRMPVERRLANAMHTLRNKAGKILSLSQQGHFYGNQQPLREKSRLQGKTPFFELHSTLSLH